MEISLLPTLNSQLIRLDKTYGGDALAVDVIHSLLDTLDNFKGDSSIVGLSKELMHLYDLTLACRPRMANILRDIQELLYHVTQHKECSAEDLKKVLFELLKKKKARSKASVEHALDLFEPKNGLLVHSYSSVLNALLRECAKRERTPHIYIAAQSPKKTNRLIRHLHEHKIAFQVVPEFSVSQIIDRVDIALFGALTVNARDELIMGPGSASLIAQLDTYQVPNYALVTTNKFSFWEEELESAFKEVRPKQLSKEIKYQKEVFSHDIVPVSLVTGIITEEGVLTPLKAKLRFEKLQAEHFEREKIVREGKDT